MGEHHFDYTTDEAHIVRRVGGATIVIWDCLPEEVRGKILEEAVHLHDKTDSRVNMSRLRQDVERFIARHKGAYAGEGRDAKARHEDIVAAATLAAAGRSAP